ncbi:MAG: NEW3 domain-containing protein [Dehalococcoidia bacterium]
MKFLRSIALALVLLLTTTGIIWAAWSYTAQTTVNLTITELPSDPGLSVSPATLPLTVGRGETHVFSVVITNNGTDQLRGVAVQAEGLPVGVELRSAVSALGAGESREGQIWLEIADDAVPGDYVLDIILLGIRAP